MSRKRKKMTIRRFVKRLRSPRTHHAKNGQLVLVLIFGLYMYIVVLKRRVTKFERGDATIDENENGDIRPKESSLLTVQSLRSITRLTSKSSKIDNPVKKVTRLKELSHDDDPFNRKGLPKDKNGIKLAEKNPIETEGRVVRAKLESSLEQATGDEPIILVWKAMEYQMKHYKEYLEFITPPECGSCRITANRAHVSDCVAMVHFNSPDLRKFMDLPDPRTRNPRQVYVFWSRETPAKTYHFAEVLRNPRFDTIFNWTMNYRRDSDIIDYFGNVEYELRFLAEKKSILQSWFEKIISRKREMAIWVVSNCNNTRGAAERMKYAMDLIDNGLKVTKYGSCFNNRFQGREFVKALQRHKFYLSFENSIHCPDYISEKFWRNGLRAGAVPIVWGPTKEDVQAIAPHHSFIHAEDFKSHRQLVEYLKYLNKNDTAYMEYHRWRVRPIDESVSYEEIEPTHRSSFCRLCKKVTAKNLVPKTIPSIYQWFYQTRYIDDKCLGSS